MTPFASPGFRNLWSSTLASACAQGMERTATAWLVLEVGGGAFAVGLVFAARMLPTLLLGLIAGTFADRADRPRQLLAVAASLLCLMAGFGWISGTGELQMWQIIAVSFAAGCLTVFDIPARQALVLDTIPRNTAPRALALNALAARFATAIGAVLAGYLIARIGIASSYYTSALLYGLGGAVVATITVTQNRRTTAPPPFRHALGEAARLILDQPGIRTLFVAGLVCEVFAFSFLSALPLFAQDVLVVGAEGLGTLNAAVSIGGAIAVIVLSIIPSETPRHPLLGATFLLYGIAIVTFATTRSLWLAAALLLVIGFCAAAFDVLQQTLIQLSVPDAQRGRAVGVWILGIGSAPVGHLEMGATAGALGVAPALLLNGTLTILSAIALWLYVPAYRWQLRRELLPKRDTD